MRPIHPRWLLALGGLIAASALAYYGQPYYEFGTPRAQILSTVQTIGVMPLSVPDDLPDQEAVTARYEAEIVRRLQSAGFTVVAPAVMREIQQQIRTTLGGMYDPITGQPLKEKFDAFNEFSTNEYLAAHKVDAILRPLIRVRPARFAGNTAQWDGASDSSSGRSSMGNFMSALAGAQLSGHVRALSFVVRLSDAGGKVLYTAAGGIQLLGYARVEVHGLLTSTKQLDVDPKSIMTDPARDARALSLALDPLLLGTEAHPADIPSPPLAPASAKAAAQPGAPLPARYPRLTLAPLELADIPQRDAVRARYADALTAQLTRLGFQVLNSDEFGRRWEAERAASGGYYDPLTGRPDKAKIDAARARVLQGLPEGSRPDAVVVARVVTRAVPYSAGTAEWDGVTQPVETTGRSPSLFDAERNRGGHLSANSLVLAIVDAAGVKLFDGVGGIELTELVEDGRPVPLSANRLFAEPAWDRRAVEIALAPLAPAAPSGAPR
ncbi:MAG: hypothetical protein JSR36_07895 [Proteobacteria bacterium]|nr:hypothetical protein [Pseudomonadota bacterium]